MEATVVIGESTIPEPHPDDASENAIAVNRKHTAWELRNWTPLSVRLKRKNTFLAVIMWFCQGSLQSFKSKIDIRANPRSNLTDTGGIASEG